MVVLYHCIPLEYENNTVLPAQFRRKREEIEANRIVHNKANEDKKNQQRRRVAVLAMDKQFLLFPKVSSSSSPAAALGTCSYSTTLATMMTTSVDNDDNDNREDGTDDEEYSYSSMFSSSVLLPPPSSSSISSNNDIEIGGHNDDGSIRLGCDGENSTNAGVYNDEWNDIVSCTEEEASLPPMTHDTKVQPTKEVVVGIVPPTTNSAGQYIQRHILCFDDDTNSTTLSIYLSSSGSNNDAADDTEHNRRGRNRTTTSRSSNTSIQSFNTQECGPTDIDLIDELGAVFGTVPTEQLLRDSYPTIEATTTKVPFDDDNTDSNNIIYTFSNIDDDDEDDELSSIQKNEDTDSSHSDTMYGIEIDSSNKYTMDDTNSIFSSFEQFDEKIIHAFPRCVDDDGISAIGKEEDDDDDRSDMHSPSTDNNTTRIASNNDTNNTTTVSLDLVDDEYIIHAFPNVDEDALSAIQKDDDDDDDAGSSTLCCSLSIDFNRVSTATGTTRSLPSSEKMLADAITTMTSTINHLDNIASSVTLSSSKSRSSSPASHGDDGVYHSNYDPNAGTVFVATNDVGVPPSKNKKTTSDSVVNCDDHVLSLTTTTTATAHSLSLSSSHYTEPSFGNHHQHRNRQVQAPLQGNTTTIVRTFTRLRTTTFTQRDLYLQNIISEGGTSCDRPVAVPHAPAVRSSSDFDDGTKSSTDIVDTTRGAAEVTAAPNILVSNYHRRVGQNQLQSRGSTGQKHKSGPVDLDESVYDDDTTTGNETIGATTSTRSGGGSSIGQPHRSGRKRNSGPVDLDDSIFDDDTTIDDIRDTSTSSCHRSASHNDQRNERTTNNSGPVDLDDSVIDTTTTISNKADVATASFDGRSGLPIDTDVIFDLDEGFDTILNNHEDEFLDWNSNRSPKIQQRDDDNIKKTMTPEDLDDKNTRYNMNIANPIQSTASIVREQRTSTTATMQASGTMSTDRLYFRSYNNDEDHDDVNSTVSIDTTEFPIKVIRFDFHAQF